MITLEYMNVGHSVVFEIANTNIIFDFSVEWLWKFLLICENRCKFGAQGCRTVASLTVSGGQDFHFRHFFPQISINFSYFSSNFSCYLPHFGPPGGWVAHPRRPWLRHCRSGLPLGSLIFWGIQVCTALTTIFNNLFCKSRLGWPPLTKKKKK